MTHPSPAAGRILALALLVLALASPRPAHAQTTPAAAAAAGPSVQHLLGQLRGDSLEPAWAALLRIRAVERDYQSDRQLRSMYAQLRAQLEANLGNHAAALEHWDSAIRPDTTGAGAARELVARARVASVLEAISAVADTARVIMVNERHHAGSDRLLTLELLRMLRKRGYRYFAAEALAPNDTALARRGYALERITGGYIGEPVFAEVIREALQLGYEIVPYEMEPAQDSARDSLTPQQRRDRAQARNLYERTLARDSTSKVIVHAGFAHVQERASDGWYPMALYFRELSGVNPVTVDQTWLSEHATREREHPAYRAASRLLADSLVLLVDSAGRPLAPASFDVDFEVLVPRTTYEAGRPSWMRMGWRREPRDVAVPECAARHCFVEARVPGEPNTATVLDRAEADRKSSVRLYVPRVGGVRFRVVDAGGQELRSWTP